MSVELPEPMLSFVDERVRQGSYADAADYLRDLVKRDREAQAGQRLRELVQEGLDSGPASPLTEAEIDAIRARIASLGR
ncbi:MAG: type II toxin-antitoxin system ParD family antitoxin [Rubrivivax sp.]|nr:type II toxin-antitoxin system ParD family antitoxin [Rubrivivax sp.]